MINQKNLGHISGTPSVDNLNQPKVPAAPTMTLMSIPGVPAAGWHVELTDPIIFGTLTINGQIWNPPSGGGSSGYVLTTDGSGNLSWQPAVHSIDFGTTGLKPAAPTSNDVVVTGALNVTNGGTGADNATDAMVNLLPDQAGHAGEVLVTDGSGGLSWAPGVGVGTVTSVDVDSTVSGLTFSGGPIDAAGVITMNGVLDISSGGTGQTTANDALNAFLPDQTGHAGEVLTSDGVNAVWAPGSGGAGTVTSVDVSGGFTGLTFSGGPITTSGVITMAGLLEVSAGGTGLNALGAGVQLGLAFDVNGPQGFVTYNGDLGTPNSGTLTNCVDLPITTGVSGTAPGIIDFLVDPSSANLAAAVTDETGTGLLVFNTSPTFITPILGTPQSGTLTNCDDLPITTGVSGMGAGVVDFLVDPSSFNLAAAVTDETGTGSLVFADTPTLISPILGTPTSVTLTNADGLPLTTGVVGILPIANGGTNMSTVGIAGTALITADGSTISYGYPDQAVNLSNGNAFEIPYQSAANTTAFIAPGVNNQVLTATTGGAPTWGPDHATIGTTEVSLGDTVLTLDGLTYITVTQNPTADLQLTTKAYVDARTGAINNLGAAETTTSANIALNGLYTLNGYALHDGSIVLVKDQTLPAENGLYVAHAGAWTYAPNATTWADYVGGVVFITEGDFAGGSWLQTAPAGGTLGVTAMDWVRISQIVPYTAGTGISIYGNVIDNTGVLSFDGGTTGLTPAGVTTGDIVLGGTLAIANGGTGLTALGTGVQTALGNAVDNSGGFVTYSGALGAPLSGNFSTGTFTWPTFNQNTTGTASNVTGVVAINHGGTGQTTATAGFNALAPSQGGNTGKFLTTNGTNTSWATLPDVGTVNAGLANQMAYYAADGNVISGLDLVTINGNALVLGADGIDSGFLSLKNGVTETVDIKVAAGTLSYSFTLPTGSGSGGQILSTDGSGVTSWIDLSVSNIIGFGTDVAFALGFDAGTPGGILVSGGDLGQPSGGDFTVGTMFTWPTFNQNTTGTADNVTGVVAIINGGTGETTANDAFNALAPDQTGNTGKYLITDGTNTSWAVVAGSGTINPGLTNQMAYYAADGDVISGWDLVTINGNALVLGADGVDSGFLSLKNGVAETVDIKPALGTLSWSLTLPTGSGSGGQILSTDGSGATSWIDLSLSNISGFGTDVAFTLGFDAGTPGGILISGGDLGQPSGGDFTVGTFTWPTFNQNTTGTADNVTGVVAITNGGTGATTANDAFNALAPDQSTNTGKFLTTDGTNTSWASAVTGPGGNNYEVQFNYNGAFGGSSTFTFDYLSNILYVGTGSGDEAIPGLLGITGAGGSQVYIGVAALNASYQINLPMNPPFFGAGVKTAMVATGNSAALTFEKIVTSVDVSGGSTGLTTSGGPITGGSGTITLGGTLAATNGGTGLTTYATGDILYASAANTLAKRTIGSAGQILTVAGGVPTWQTGSYPRAYSVDIFSNISITAALAALSITPVEGSTFVVNNYSAGPLTLSINNVQNYENWPSPDVDYNQVVLPAHSTVTLAMYNSDVEDLLVIAASWI